MLRLLALVLLLLCPSVARAQRFGFLEIDPSAAAAGRGETGVAHGEGAFAAWWNPAALAEGGSEAGVTYRNWVQGSRLYAGAARFAAGPRQSVGLFVTAFDAGYPRTGTFPATDEDGGFSLRTFAAGAGYGHRFGNVMVGAAVKAVREDDGVEAGTGFALDAGVQAVLAREIVRVGVAVQDLGRASLRGGGDLTLPTTLRGGLSARPFSVIADFGGDALASVVLSAEVVHRFAQTAGALEVEERTQLRAGLEAEAFEILIFRAGVITRDEIRRFTFGGGLRQGPVRFDYSIQPFAGDFEGVGHALTFRYGW